MSDALGIFAQARYASLATTRRNGNEVLTPIWLAQDGERLVCFSAADAGKVKRIKHTPAIRLAPCTMNGKITGAWHGGTAGIMTDEADINAAYAALKRKYGLVLSATNVLARLSGRFHRRAVLAIELAR